MKVVIEYQGKQYESNTTDEHTVEEISEMFYKNFSEMDKFKMELAGGGSLIVGKAALQSAVIMFLP